MPKQKGKQILGVFAYAGKTAVALLCVFALLWPSGASAGVAPSSLVTLHNQARSASGLGSLSLSSTLSQAALNKANDMLAKDYFSHTSPSGVTPWDWIKGAGYSYTQAGENLAIDFNDSQLVYDAWMASPTHKANILNSAYTQMGVGVAQGEYQGRQTTVSVVMFGQPKQAVAPAPVPAPAVQETQQTSQPQPAPTVSSSPNTPVVLANTSVPVVVRDTTPPARPEIKHPETDQYLSAQKIEVRGTAEAFSTVNIYDQQKLVATSAALEDGVFRAEIEVEEGELLLAARARDEAGNESQWSEDVRVVIDVTPPLLHSDQIAYVSADVLQGGTFLTKVELDEPIDGFSAAVVYQGNKECMTANTEGRSFTLSLQAPTDVDQASIAFRLADQAGNLLEIPERRIAVEDAYTYPVLEEPLQTSPVSILGWRIVLGRLNLAGAWLCLTLLAGLALKHKPGSRTAIRIPAKARVAIWAVVAIGSVVLAPVVALARMIKK